MDVPFTLIMESSDDIVNKLFLFIILLFSLVLFIILPKHKYLLIRFKLQ